MQETEETKIEESVDENLLEDGKNKLTVSCKRCGSVILSPNFGQIENIEHMLPSMTTKAKQDKEIPVDKLFNYWKVDNIYTFENIGFSNTVEDVKYLICADCEIGPVGWHSISTKISYVALARVSHK